MAQRVIVETQVTVPSLNLSISLPDGSVRVEWRLFAPVYWGWKLPDGSQCSASDSGGVFYVDGKMELIVSKENVVC
jgi:hypothetical protein